MTKIEVQELFAQNESLIFDRQIWLTVNRMIKSYACVVLIGSRVVGKTTSARRYSQKQPSSIYLNLSNPDTRGELSDGKKFLEQHKNKIIILDDAHEFRALYPALKEHIQTLRDDKATDGKLLLSVAPDSVFEETLCSTLSSHDYARLEVTGILINELYRNLHDDLDFHQTDTSPFDCEAFIDHLLLRGGLPDSLFSHSDDGSHDFLSALINSYVHIDLPLAIKNIDPYVILNCLRFIAWCNGREIDLDCFSEAVNEDSSVVRQIVSGLVQALVVRELEPLQTAGSSSSTDRCNRKLYIRDSGMLSSLLDINNDQELRESQHYTSIWEGFIVESVIGVMNNFNLYHSSYYVPRPELFGNIELVIKLKNNETWGLGFSCANDQSVTKSASTTDVDLSTLAGVTKRIIVHGEYPKPNRESGSLSLLDIIQLVERADAEYHYRQT